MNTILSQLRQSLNKKEKGNDIVFVAPNQDVLKGKIQLKEHDSRDLGSIYLSVGNFYKTDRKNLITGRMIKPGQVTVYKGGEIRCFKGDNCICVACFNRKAENISIVLKYCPMKNESGSGFDEGLFTYFGTVDWIGSAWSDNDPSTCQVITIEDLRAYMSRQEKAT